MKTKTLAVTLTAIILMVSGAFAIVPNSINFQGTLTDSSGAPETGIFSMQFLIYADSTGGSSLWSETHTTVDVNNGLFWVFLGSVTSFPGTIFDGSVRWLETEVESETLSPREKLVTVPYGFKSKTADTADDADMVDGHHYSSAWEPDGYNPDNAPTATVRGEPTWDEVDARDYGRSGVATDLYEDGQSLENKYVEENQPNSVNLGMMVPEVISSLDGVTNDGGNINLVASSNITITPDDVANTITIAAAGGGDITSVAAGDGLSGGGIAGPVALDVGAGTGISVSVDQVGLDLNYADGRYVNEGQSSSVTSAMITNGTVVNADISNAASITPSKVYGTAWTSLNDGSGSGLDADRLDGQHGSYYQNASNLNAGTISESRLPQNAIDASEIQDGSITSTDILNSTITGADIATGTITSSDISDGTVTGTDIANETVTSSDIDDGTITASDLGVNCVEWSELDDPLVISSGSWDIDKNTSAGVMLLLDNAYTTTSYCDIAWMRAEYQTSTSHWNLYSKTKGGKALYTIKLIDDNQYSAYIGAYSSTSEGLYVYGTSVGTGPACTIGATPSGPEPMFASSSTEVEFTTNGTARLNNGSVYISFNRVFSETISPNIPVRVITTPVGGWSGLYMENVTTKGCWVKSGAGDANVEFNWIAIGRRQGYDQRPDITIPDPVEEERIREMKEAEMERKTR